MSELITISKQQNISNQWLDLIFVHGLNGDCCETWRNSTKNSIWAEWIADLYPEIRVLSYSYEIGATKLNNANALSIIDRANNMLDLLSVESIGQVPVGFICHSYGGLLVKNVIKFSSESNRSDYKAVSAQTKLIMFLATPHNGSGLANWFKTIVPLLPTNAISDMEKNSPYLRNLNQWYIAHNNKYHIETISFFETKKTKGVIVVDADSADIGIPDYPAIALDENHISISKPKDTSSHLFKKTVLEIERLKKKLT